MAVGDVEVSINSPNAFSGAYCDGVDDRITAESVDEISKNGAFTLYFEYRCEKSLAATQTIFAASQDTNDRFAVCLYQNGLEIQTGIYNGVSYFVKKSGSTLRRKHYQVIVTFDGTTLNLYLDGVNQTGTSQPSTGPNKLIVFGSNTGQNGAWFCGSVGNTWIYKGAATSDDLTKLNNRDFNISLEKLRHYPLINDYEDKINGKNGTNNGTRFVILDEDVQTQAESQRVNANDTFMLADTGFGKQVILTNIQETL